MTVTWCGSLAFLLNQLRKNGQWRIISSDRLFYWLRTA